MPITALPQATVRAIGSTSVISDACSVVKELLDNALDASATSIGIEISPNTVGVIQVKDNGHGIPSSDHPFVCTRTFTSKIQTVEDLRRLGGKSLGFRGEALASTAEVSGGVTVTTRVEAELVGSSIKYGRTGELISSQHVSHPIGTTVRISDLFRHVPVRRQTALKNSTKTLAKIKKLIQIYATAQPSKRLSLKVLKAKNENNNWIYAPAPNATLIDAALKIVGTDVTSNCTLKTWPPDSVMNFEQPQTQLESEFGLVALLPDSGADCAKLSNAGQYLSIDGRPISSSRGIGQDISKLYKSYLRSAFSRSEGSPSITDPFLCLHMQCPEASYDVNIEPAKDDVLFEDPQRLLTLVEDLFQNIYGEKEAPHEKRTNPGKGKDAISNNGAFDLLLARKSQPEDFQSPVNSDSGPRSGFVTARFLGQSAEPLPRSRMTDGQSSNSRISEGSGTESRRGSKDPEFLIPWSIKRCNAPFRQIDNSRVQRTAINKLLVNGPGQASTNSRRSSHETPRRYSASSFLPSPSASTASTSGSPSDTQASQIPQMTPTPRGHDDATRALRELARERYGNGALDTWFGKTTQASLSRMVAKEQSGDDQEIPSLSQPAHEIFRSQGLSSSESGENTNREIDVPRISSSNAAGSSLHQTQSSTIASPGPTLELAGRRQEFPVLEQWSSRLHTLSNNGTNTDLENALDFENRKREAIQKRREQLKGHSKLSTSTNSPHLSRYLAARAALQTDSITTSRDQDSSTANELVVKPVLNPHDPRSFLIRSQNKNRHDELSKGHKVRRVNTSRLPFEKIPEGYELHDISVSLTVDLPALTTLSENSFENDLYTQCGEQFEAFHACGSQSDLISLWASRLSALVRNNYKTKEGSGIPAPEFDFSALTPDFERLS